MSRDSLIGAYNAAGTTQYYLEGKIDQVRIFTKALSSSEVSTLYAETAETVTSLEPLGNETTDTLQVLGDSSCIATYRFENNEDDLSGNNNGTGTEIQYAVGRYGQAASFNGSTSKVDTSLTLDTYTSNGGSISFWFKTSQTTPFQAIIGSQTAQNGASYGTVIFIGDTTSTSSSESISVWDRNGSTTSMFYTGGGSTTYQDGNWHHVVVTSTSTTKNIYIDGVSQTVSYALSGSASANLKFTDIQFGASLGYTGTNYFDGQLDQVRIFNKALSASEVTTLYNENSLVASYRFEGNANDDMRAYDGSATNVSYEYGLNFTPDFVWIKNRTYTNDHGLYDSSRGATKYIAPNTTGAEATYSTVLTSFDTGGFTFGSNPGGNRDGDDFVAWCLKANGGTTSSNTDGTITSTVQANQDAGFSIVKWTGTQTNGSIGHGLTAAPEMLIVKDTTNTYNWYVFIKPSGATNNIRIEGLNTTAAGTVQNSQFTTTSSLIENLTIYASLNTTGATMLAYAFHSVEGFSKIGSYTGNGSTNGPIVETGFEPAFVMIKGSSLVSQWNIVDNRRDTINPATHRLFANLSNAEATGIDALNFLSNGFQIANNDAGYNSNGNTYLYIAFAADPDTEAPTVAKSFSTVAYTGTQATLSIDSLGFKAGLIWLKNRDITGYNHFFYDIVRGPGKAINTNLTAAEYSLTGVSSFDDDGFTLGSNYETNRSGDNHIAWAWKADDNEPTIFGGPAKAVYKFEDNANDVTGDYNGTATNITYSSSGKFNKAAVFNGTNAYVHISSLTIPTTATISLWVKANSGHVFSSQTSDYRREHPQMYWDTTNNRFAALSSRADDSSWMYTGTLNGSDWNHIVLVQKSDGTSYLYANGSLQDSVTTTASTYTPIAGFTLGAKYEPEASGFIGLFDGEIDQVRIYNGALAQEQVTELYNETVDDNDDLELGGPPETIISANANAGFSIVKYEGDGVSGKQVPHGLSATPEFVIYKRLDSTANWIVKSTLLNTDDYLALSLTDQVFSDSGVFWNGTAPTSTVFTLGNSASVNASGGEYIAYCFHSVAGYSKIGTYSGSGASGNAQNVGFAPDLVILKSTNAVTSWAMFDTVRGANVLYSNLSNAESSDSRVTLTSTGFEFTGAAYNESGRDWIYMAFKIN